MVGLCGDVLCMDIIIMKNGTKEHWEYITAEAIGVKNMMEEYTHILQHGWDVGIGFVACLL